MFCWSPCFLIFFGDREITSSITVQVNTRQMTHYSEVCALGDIKGTHSGQPQGLSWGPDVVPIGGRCLQWGGSTKYMQHADKIISQGLNLRWKASFQRASSEHPTGTWHLGLCRQASGWVLILLIAAKPSKSLHTPQLSKLTPLWCSLHDSVWSG